MINKIPVHIRKKKKEKLKKFQSDQKYHKWYYNGSEEEKKRAFQIRASNFVVSDKGDKNDIKKVMFAWNFWRKLI